MALYIQTNMVTQKTGRHLSNVQRCLDSTLNTLNKYRSQYGASERSLSQAMVSMELYSGNLQSAHSQIIDADYAAETANLSRHQFVQQAGMAILVQGKSLGQGLLGLL